VFDEPSLGTPYLMSRFQNGPTIPSFPREVAVRVRRKVAIFVGKDQNVIVEDDEEVAEFGPLPSSAVALVEIHIW
jgi:hypothetical protein